jgi:hypothetical protein
MASATEIDASAINDFRMHLRGELLGRGDAGYDAARRVWNGMIDKHPASIIRCAEVSEAHALSDPFSPPGRNCFFSGARTARSQGYRDRPDCPVQRGTLFRLKRRCAATLSRRSYPRTSRGHCYPAAQ